MSYYGYTTVIGGTATRIVLHNTFNGFPNNDDPEGNAIGAAKVTCAHEFKHASQRAQSGWSEGGWVELDATWMEDVVYDVVNDYYNYLPSGSGISAPGTSLNGGSTSTGSYEDCIWQHYMSETYGEQIVIDFWDWRSSNTGQNVLYSYNSVLGTYGSSLAEAYIEFGAWNLATSSRALSGIGYGEPPTILWAGHERHGLSLLAELFDGPPGLPEPVLLQHGRPARHLRHRLQRPGRTGPGPDRHREEARRYRRDGAHRPGRQQRRGRVPDDSP